METIRRFSMFIDGDWVDADERFEIRSPATEELVASVAKGGIEHADRAIAAAKAAHADGRWQLTPPLERAAVLDAIADRLTARIGDLAVLEALENGAPLRQAGAFVERLIERTRTITIGIRLIRPRTSARSSRPRHGTGSWATSTPERPKAPPWPTAGADRPARCSSAASGVEPTIFTDVSNDMTIAREEIFGPVLAVIRSQDTDEAIRIANDTEYGLSAGVWSTDNQRAIDVASQLEAGTVWVNDWHMVNAAYPFGGYKQSALGRELGPHALDEYTEEKFVHIDLSGRLDQRA